MQTFLKLAFQVIYSIQLDLSMEEPVCRKRNFIICKHIQNLIYRFKLAFNEYHINLRQFFIYQFFQLVFLIVKSLKHTLKMQNLSSIFKRAYLVMKAGAKTVKVQEKTITLQQLDAKIRIWQPITQISSIQKNQNFKYPLSFIRKNIEPEFYVEAIKYILVRQLWWIFYFPQNTKKEEYTIQAYIQCLSYSLKDKYYRISNIDLQHKIYMSELLILVMCKLASRFFADSFTQIQVGGDLESQLYIILNKLLIGIQVGPKAYHLHLQHFLKQNKKDVKISQHIIKSQEKAQNKQNQKPLQVGRQDINKNKLGALISVRQGSAEKVPVTWSKKQSNYSKYQRILPPSQVRFAKRNNIRMQKASKAFLYQRSKKKQLAPIFHKVQDQQELRFKQQLKKTLQVPPLPQAVQEKYGLGEISEKYLRGQHKKYAFQGKNPLIYQRQNKKKSLSLQRISSTMSHELAKNYLQVLSAKESKVSFKPQSYSNHYQIVNDIVKAQASKTRQSKIYKSSISKKNINFKFNSPIGLSKNGLNTPENRQQTKQSISDLHNREGILHEKTQKLDYWIKAIKNLGKQSLKDKTDIKQLISVYQRKLKDKSTLRYQVFQIIDRIKQNENIIQLQRLSSISKNEIGILRRNQKQEEARQLLANLIRLAPQKIAQLEEEADYILKRQSHKDLNSRQLKIQKQKFIKFCQRQYQMHENNLLMPRAKRTKAKTSSIAN